MSEQKFCEGKDEHQRIVCFGCVRINQEKLNVAKFAWQSCARMCATATTRRDAFATDCDVTRPTDGPASCGERGWQRGDAIPPWTAREREVIVKMQRYADQSEQIQVELSELEHFLLDTRETKEDAAESK